MTERDPLIDAIRAACERYPSMCACLWAACEEHRGDVAERDREDEEDDDEAVDDNEAVDEVDEDEEEANEDEHDDALGNVINLAKYRHARSRHRR